MCWEYSNTVSNNTIQFVAGQKMNVNINVYNIEGILVKKIINEQKAAGQHSIEWNGNDLKTGVYFVNISSDGKSLKTIKLVKN